jgi:outer membrane protein assembly factor BamB/plastocyanin
MTARRLGRRVIGAGALVATSLIVVACGSGSSKTNSTSTTATTTAAAVGSTWELPGADVGNTRDVSSPINASNVSTLGVAWTVPITASGTFGAYATTPVVANGILYTQDLASNVYAINLASGKLLWTKKYNAPDEGPNGVTVVSGKVFGATSESAFALQAATGEQLWTKKLVRNGNEGIDMAPGYHEGTIYVSTVPGNAKAFYAGNGQAILYALDAETGATKWKFEQVPKDLWSEANKNINSGGGLWDPPTFDSKGNLYIGISNPAPWPGTAKFPWGSSRPGPNLYTDSVVKLNGTTGKLMWYYQLTPHDIFDHDVQNSPILSTANGTPIVIDGGKGGILFAVNQETGKLLWKRPVGVHNGIDNLNLEAEKGDYSKLKIPITVEPGDLGGIESQLASNGKTVFAAVNNLAVKFKGQSDAEGELVGGFGAATGDFVAVNEATGAVEWDKKLPTAPYGAATITNNLVFTTTFDGVLRAFEVSSGNEVFKTTLSAGTNAPVAIVGNTVITAGSFPQTPGQKAEIIAYRLGSTGKLSTPAPAPAKTTTTTTKPAPAAPAAGGTIKIEADPTGLLKYTESKITASEGEDTVSFTNNSPVEHDVVIETSAKKTIGQTPIFDKGTKSFKVKLAAGTYTYFCSVPGHREAGMQGTLTVTAAHG